jgi:hypothetical protein
MSTSDEKTRGFAVSDRRSFTSGEPKPADASPPAPATAPAAEATTPAATGAAPGAATAAKAVDKGSDARLPPVDFHTFVLSLGSSALIHLGDLERAGEAEPGKSEKDLPLAKHSIDILSMLQEKTKGNLTHEEAQLLESLLYDLRLRYVSAAK